MSKTCEGKHHSIKCTKFKDTEIDGHNSYMISDSTRGETKKCPKNFALVGFCSSNLEKDCDGKAFSITCAPIKFKECINPDDVLNTEIDLQYRTVLPRFFL